MLLAHVMVPVMDGAWVTGPERPKCAKDEVKEARSAQRRPEGLKGSPKGPRRPKRPSAREVGSGKGP